MIELLKLLEENARYSDEELAAMLGMTEDEVRETIDKCKRDGIIRGYNTIVDWDKTDLDIVTARIEIKASPKKDKGFEELAELISGFDEVRSLYLMSGGYDLALTIAGKSLKDIANFVAHKLAPLDSVQSTATHFVLRKYKEKNTLLVEPDQDEREVIV